MGYRYYRSCLTPDEQKAYDIYVQAVKNFTKEIDLPRLTKPQLTRVLDAVNYDYPEFFYVKRGNESSKPYYYYIYPDHLKYSLCYDISKEAVQKATRQIEAIAHRLIAKAKESGCRSDLAVAAYLHNYITDNIGYTEKSLSPKRNHCILGGLINKECVCEGYAKLYLYFLDRAGIPAIYICGKTSSERDTYHAWNMVKLDGNWYHTDATWNANARGKGNWEYFMLTEKEITSKSHFMPKDFPIPKSLVPLNLNRDSRSLR